VTTVASSVSSLDNLSRVVADAYAARTRLRIVGRGTWLDAGRPVDADAALDISTLAGIVEYSPGDFTLTALAGTTLADLDAAVMANGQYLPLDPVGGRAGTLGATLATTSVGPLAASSGTPRDGTLGVTFVDGTGAVIRGGGRVVKNVAGFDLVRLVVGAWGTLGVIGEATVRLRAIPQVDCTMAVPLPSDLVTMAATLHAVSGDQLQPLAAEILSPQVARNCGLAPSAILLMRLAGNTTSVRHRQGALASVARAQEVPSTVWDHLSGTESPASSAIRVSVPPSEIAGLWMDLTHRLGAADVAMLGDVRRGVVRIVVPRDSEEPLRDLIAKPPTGSTVICEQLSAASWPAPSPRLTHRLARTLKETFDPQGILNPGILVPASA